MEAGFVKWLMWSVFVVFKVNIDVFCHFAIVLYLFAIVLCFVWTQFVQPLYYIHWPWNMTKKQTMEKIILLVFKCKK